MSRLNIAGSKRDAGEESDQHADAGDQAELGDALVVGRQERQETRRRGERGERQRRARAPAGLQQRRVHIIDLVAFGPIANAELQSEIDPDADEQHREIDRYQVERADHQQADRRRDREADDEIDEHGENDAAQRSASHKMNSTMAMVTVAFSAAFSLMVANSSSDSGTGPVKRTRA